MTEEIETSSRQRKKRKALKLTGLILTGLVALVVLTSVSIMVIYPAILRSTHRIDTPNGIDLMEDVEIGGINQTLYFRGQDIENPVILFLHGGPGMPSMAMLHDWQFELEDYFTFVHWDQRNAGKTFFLNDPTEVRETLTFERVVADAYEVSQHIRESLGKDQIIVVGYSWGSILGSQLVQQYPQYFSAYISIGQAVNMRENEQLGYEALQAVAHAGGNRKSIAAVEALGPPPLGGLDDGLEEYIHQIRAQMTKYGYSIDMLQMVWLTITSPYYTFREQMFFVTVDVMHYQRPLYEYIFSEDFDIRNFGTDYQIPVFYIMGELDRQTSYQLAKEFFEEISAPYKSFFSIPNSGHAPMHENTTEFIRILVEKIRPLVVER